MIEVTSGKNYDKEVKDEDREYQNTPFGIAMILKTSMAKFDDGKSMEVVEQVPAKKAVQAPWVARMYVNVSMAKLNDQWKTWFCEKLTLKLRFEKNILM